MKVLVDEPEADQVDAIWSEAARIVAVRTVYVEAYVAIAAACRSRRISKDGLARAKSELEGRWAEVYDIELDERLARAAAEATEQFGLKAADAIHLAAAAGLADPELVLATWDARLSRSALDAGLAVAPAP